MLSADDRSPRWGLARAWRRALGAARDRRHRLGRQDLHEGADRRTARAARRVASNPANFNTEIGLPLAILGAPTPAPR